MILVSRCLLGENCKYNGGNNRNEAVIAALVGKEYLAVCPEQLAGLPCPRPPAELCGAAVVDKEGRDRTEAFHAGAARTLALAQKHGAERCILKDGSPSCGVHYIYDGSFSGTRIPGRGLTAQLLADHGIALSSEADCEISQD